MAKHSSKNRSKNATKPSRAFESDATALTSNPFAALQGTVAPDGPAATPAAPSPAEAPRSAAPQAPAASDLSAVGRVIVRRQKKGQGGKTVACVEGLPATVAAALVPKLKRALGCAGRLEDDTMILGTRDHQGVAQWLRAQGASDVRLGN